MCVCAYFSTILSRSMNWTMDNIGGFFLDSRVIYCSPIINYLVKNPKKKEEGTSNSANDRSHSKSNTFEEREEQAGEWERHTSTIFYTYIIFIFVKLVPLFSFNKYQIVWNCFFFLFLSLSLFIFGICFGFFWVKDIKIDREKNRSVYERRDSPIFHIRCVYICVYFMFTFLYFTTPIRVCARALKSLKLSTQQ